MGLGQGLRQLQAWVSTKWSPINSFFCSPILIFHQYSLSKIHFNHTILQPCRSPFEDTQAWSCRRLWLGSMTLIWWQSLSSGLTLPTFLFVIVIVAIGRSYLYQLHRIIQSHYTKMVWQHLRRHTVSPPFRSYYRH